MLDGVRTCSTWCVSPSANRSELAHHRMPEDRIYATTPSLANGLAAADPNHADVRILGPAVDRRLFFPSALDEEDHVKYGSDVAVVMSAVDFTPEAIGLKWDSHQHLLSEIVRILRENPQRLHKDAADRVIELASRRTQVALDSGEVREQLAQFISAGLAPTLTALKLIRKLAADEVRVKLWGCNWDLHSATAALPSGPPPSHEERNKIYNAARVIVHVRNDRWHRQHLLDALAAGATVVGHDEQYSDETNDSSWQDLWTAVPRFGTISEAAATIRRWLNEPAAGASAVEPARRIALHNHSIEKRLQTLLGNETG